MLRTVSVSRIAASVFLILLMAFVVVRGVVPGFSTLYTDFPNYYVAGKIALEGTHVHRLYDDAWFQDRMRSYGIDVQGKFSPFPPPTALLFVPLGPLEPITAQRVMTALNLLFLFGSVRLLARIMDEQLLGSALFVFMSGIGLANCFRFGQVYIALSFAIIACYYLYTLQRPLMAGIVLGFFIPVKYFPALFLVPFAFKKEWRLILGAGLSSLSLVLVSISVFGWDVHQQFIESVFGQHLRGNLTLQDPFAYNFQSFDSLFRRLFVRDVTLNPRPFVDVPLLYHGLKYSVIATIALLMLRGLFRLHKSASDKELPLAIAVCGIFGLLISPAGATYHFVLLWLPVTLLFLFCDSLDMMNEKWFLVSVYAAIGFIPYSVFSRFDGSGLQSILAYPRLFLTIVLFVFALHAIRAETAKFSSSEKLPAV